MFKLKNLTNAFDRQNLSQALILLLVAIVTWASYFHHFRQFGLYFEDYTRIPFAMQWEWSEIWEYLFEVPEAVASSDYEGRPLHPAFIILFSALGESIGGLPALYLIAYGITLINVLLFYRLMKQTFDQPFFVLSSTLAFSLFPVNTNHAWLTSAFGILPALTLLLIALNLYLTNSRRNLAIAYGAVFISLFYYEKFFPLFWAAPLLKLDWKWNAQFRRELLRHGTITACLFLIVVVIRKLNGEGRVSDLNSNEIIRVLLHDLIVGPAITIAIFFYRPIQALTTLKMQWLLPLGLVMLAIALCLHHVRLTRTAQSSSSAATTQSIDIHKLIRLSIAGLALLILAYPLSFTGSIYRVNGRESLVHVAAIVGGAVLCGCFCTALEWMATRHRKRFFSTLGLSLYFTLLVAFGFAVQQDYVISTQYERNFWTDLSKLCPDMTKDTVILVEFSRLPRRQQISPFMGWFTPVLGHIYKFPDSWTDNRNFDRARQPKVFRLRYDWRERIAVDDDLLRIDRYTFVGRGGDKVGKVNSSNAIYLEAKEGRLSRRTEPLVLEGKTLHFKQNTSSQPMPPFRENVLHDDLIITEPEAPIQYLTSTQPLG